ncbi:protein spinster-like isoform X2 [Macrosteles quadrilineatus]|uniref:protein spinster-like isoform X2 n=1 Tax=Macrosteles quadrilineatus TaxID=74068 RepID=UPI0023E1DD56|nr:protein spinster-like isoform X2 [Macrosteles quadrilineatus]XP_054278519.1 protein spinster-like isoform X2 [Macrosteles quadrilineatus]
MPAQKFVDKHSLKILNMEPTGIPPNNSHQHLMNEDGDSVDTVVPPLSSNSTDPRTGAKRTPVENRITKRQILTVVVLCFVNMINYMDRYIIAGILTDIEKYFNLSDDKSGLLQTAFVISYMVFAPLFGYLGDRYSRRAIMAAGVFLWSLTTLIGSFMVEYHWFLLFRTLVGVGEASYSTIAPTIISDLFVQDQRSKMLALFYFAIPVGSGLGYIVGSETGRMTGVWQNGLRVTPVLGMVAVVLILFVMTNPERGESEGKTHLHATSWSRDIKLLLRNPSFMLSTAGFTCVSFVAGALAWWGPHFIYLGLRLQPGYEDVSLSDVSLKFGIITMISGLIGVPAGSFLAQNLRVRYPRADPYICACGLICSAPLLFAASLYASSNVYICYTLIFVGELFLNLNWSIVADILLYVVTPTRRSTAEAFQILISHMFGDAGSPYLVGVLSEMLKKSLAVGTTVLALSSAVGSVETGDPSPEVQFHSLQYALFTTNFVEVLGGLFFLFTALYIQQDKEIAERELAGYPDLDDDIKMPNLTLDENTNIETSRQSYDAIVRNRQQVRTTLASPPTFTQTTQP